MSAPVISDIGEESYLALGPWAKDDELFEWQLKYFIEAMFGGMQVGLDVASSDGVRSGWQRMVDPDHVLRQFLPWMAQFVGVIVPMRLSEVEERDFVKNNNGFKRGTVDFIKSFIANQLTGSKTVEVHERTTSPYHLRIVTYRAETPNITFGDDFIAHPTFQESLDAYPTFADFPSGETIIEVFLQDAKPGGLVLTYEVLDGATFRQLDAQYGTFQDELDALPTFADAVSHVPGS